MHGTWQKNPLCIYDAICPTHRGHGQTSSWSSSASWAESDLDSYMSDAAANAPLFIEAFYDACETLHHTRPDYAVPDVALINRVLANHNA
jgi:hypothetical protein